MCIYQNQGKGLHIILLIHPGLLAKVGFYVNNFDITKCSQMCVCVRKKVTSLLYGSVMCPAVYWPESVSSVIIFNKSVFLHKVLSVPQSIGHKSMLLHESYKVQCRLHERLIWSFCLMVMGESEHDHNTIFSKQKECNSPSIQYVDTHVCVVQHESKQCKYTKLDFVFLYFSSNMTADL